MLGLKIYPLNHTLHKGLCPAGAEAGPTFQHLRRCAPKVFVGQSSVPAKTGLSPGQWRQRPAARHSAKTS